MLMADDNNSDFWSHGDFLAADDSDNFSIDLDSLFAILSEESDPSSCKHSQSNPVDLSFENSFQGAGEVNNERASQPQNGIQKLEEAHQSDSIQPESSLWHPSEYSEPSNSRTGMGSECFYGSPGNFGMMFDYGKLETQPHIDSPVNSCSASLTDWLAVAHSEHDTCSGERVGGSIPAPCYSYIDSKRIPNHMSNSSTTFKFVSGDANHALGCSDYMNAMHLKNENENDFRHLGGDLHFRSGPSDFTMMENSVSNHGNLNAISGSSMEDLGSVEINPCTTPLEFSFIDAHLSSTNPPHACIDESHVSDIKSESDNTCSPSYYCGRSSVLADNGPLVDPLRQHHPDTNNFPFMKIKRENMMYKSDAVEGQLLAAETIFPDSKMDVGAEEVITGTSVHEVSMIDCTDIDNHQGTSFKCESAPYSPIRRYASCDDDDASRQSLNGIHFVSNEKLTVSVEDGRKKELLASKNACCQSVNIIDDDDDDVSAVSISSSKMQTVRMKDEKENKVRLLGGSSSHSGIATGEVVRSKISSYNAHIDDDPDICILEDISDPRLPAPAVVHGRSLAIAHHSGFNDPLHSEMGGITRFKAYDERLTFRIALQDLSQPKSEASPPDGVLAVPLLRHQRIALSWMVQKETASLHCSGGILADDQGLGKTISTIALILKERSPSSKMTSMAMKEDELEALNLDDDDDGVLHLDGMKQDGDSGLVVKRNLKISENAFVLAKGRPAAGTLVVCPTSVLRQWADELQNKVCREANLSVLVYHGSNRTRDPFELAKYDVVLTTYSIVSMEVPKQPLVDKEDEDKRKLETDGQSRMGFSSSKKRKYPPSSDNKSRKNKKGMDCALLESVARPLARVGWFRVVLDEAQSIKNHRTQVARACWGLRAKRRWCLSGTPIQNAVDDLYSYFRFLRYDPYAVYKSFCSTIKVPIHRNPTNGYRKLQAVLKTIMLRRTKGTLLDGEPIINLPPKTIELKKVDFSVEEREFYSKLEADSRAQFKVYAAAGTVKQNYVNILLMLLRLRQACDHPFLVKGYDSDSVWKSSVEIAKKLPKEKQMDLLNCLEACLAICGICNDPPEDAVVTICGHVFCNQCICEHLTGDETICPSAQCKVHLSVTSVFSRATLKSSLSEQSVHDCSINKSGVQLIEAVGSFSEGLSDSSKIKAALQVLQSISKPGYCSLKSSPESIDVGSILPKDKSDSSYVESEKAVFSDKNLVDMEKAPSDSVTKVSEKAIVFSQWTRMLDLLEARLKSSSIQYRRLDGTMSVVARDKAVKDFNTLPEVSVMIMSLKAASLGLNMVAACHVLLLDLWWNPTTEDQAIDRAHRIGQTRPVTVLRLTVKDTVEDRILALQEKKREMVASAFGEDETGSRQTRLTVDDLKYLFMA